MSADDNVPHAGGAHAVTTPAEDAPRRLSRAQKIHESTPPERNRVVDLLRALAITVVVIGHWTIIAVSAESGLEPHGVLDHARWTHPLTWIFQVMPIFFLVGGYSNALSWRSARRRNQTYAAWVRARLRRLGIPLVPLLIVWLIICAVSLAAGADPSTVRLASQMALIPTWFLASYLMVIAVAPACFVLWERFGWWSVLGGILLAGVVDAVSISLGSPLLGYPNYLIVWAAFHQLGFAWVDGRLSRASTRWALIGIGAAGLALLVGLGPYPVSMISAAGDAISNSSPTRVTMAFLGLVQAGVVLLLEKPLAALMQRPRLWFLAVMVNLRIMTWFLWHLTAMVGVGTLLWWLASAGGGSSAGAGHAASAPGPLATAAGHSAGAGHSAAGDPGPLATVAQALLPEPLSGTWWATRPLWWLALLLVTAVLVLVFGRFESVPADPRPAPPLWQPLTAAVCIVAGLGVLAGSGMVSARTGTLMWWLPLLPIAGVLCFGVVNWRPRSRDTLEP